jgi:hypothetical protein
MLTYPFIRTEKPRSLHFVAIHVLYIYLIMVGNTFKISFRPFRPYMNRALKKIMAGLQ